MYTLNLNKMEFSRLITTMEQSANDKRVAASVERRHNSQTTAALFDDAAHECDRIVAELKRAEHEDDPLEQSDCEA